MLTLPAAVVLSAVRVNHYAAIGCAFAVVVLAVAVIWRYWRGTGEDVNG